MREHRKPKLTKQSREQLSRKQADQLAPPAQPLPGQQPPVFGQNALDKMTDRKLLEDIWRKLQPVLRFFGKE